jgi:hypothetical protein
MPYSNEFANKSSHSDIVENPDVQTFLQQCEYLREPSPEEVDRFSQRFQPLPDLTSVELPRHIFAIDGSPYESLIDDRMPSTKVGYIKVSTIHILMDEFGALRVEDGRFVDPFRVAQLKKNKDSLLFVLPGTNMRWQGLTSVRDSFRARVDQVLLQKETRFRKDDYRSSLRSTLFRLASLRPDRMGTQNDELIRLHQCPSCGFKGEDGTGLELKDIEDQQFCPSCNKEVYPSDALRLWEEVNDYQSNISAMTRFMLAVEHMLPAHYIHYLLESNFPLEQLASIAFFIDGPVAIFGTCAWLSRPLMKYYYQVNKQLHREGLPSITILGLQKTGQLADYFGLVSKHIPENTVYPVDDEYRYQYIIASRDPSRVGFGDETYYGQDFLFKTASGRRFVVGIPYPFSGKGKQEEGNFHKLKTEAERYPNLIRTLALINRFETDLYANAVIPIALAHRYTAISASPGGKVLDILSRSSFPKKT